MDLHTLKTPKTQMQYIGQSFGTRTIISYYGKVRRIHYFNFICTCGVKSKGSIANLKNSTKCKKCPQVENPVAKNPHYHVWFQIKDRCFNPNNKNYHNYGGRGITICDEWRYDYHKFIKDMGYRPTDKHSLDRVDNNGDYCKDNCRWVTQDVQTRNTRKSYLIYSELNNMTFNSLVECAEYFNYSQQYICDMLKGRKTNKFKLKKID